MSATPRTDAITNGADRLSWEHPEAVELMRALERELAEKVSALSDGRWVPVTERTPDAQYDVLVSDGQFVTIGDCCKGHLWNAQLIGPVTHWMPLPEAPK